MGTSLRSGPQSSWGLVEGAIGKHQQWWNSGVCVCVCVCVCTTVCRYMCDCAVCFLPPVCLLCALRRMCCDIRGLSSSPKPAPPAIERPAAPQSSGTQVTAPSQERAQRGMSFPRGGGGGLGSSALVVTLLCPALETSCSLAPLSPPPHQWHLSRKASMCRRGCL